MISMTEAFFKALSLRLRKENDLSDFTWAMIQASPFFKEKWIRFFFPQEMLDIDSIYSVEREEADKQSMDSRADFVIHTFNRGDFVIEVKIGDTSHHFGQYEKAYKIPKEHLGYITNYPLKQEGYSVMEWKDFYASLKSSLKSVSNEEERKLIEGYCIYLEKICYIMEVKNRIDIKEMASLYDLTIAFKQVVENSTDKYQVRFYKDMPADNAKRICFLVKYNELYPEKEFYPYIGIWYDLPLGPRICGGFWKDKGWGREICDLMESKRTHWNDIELNYCKRPENDWGFFFYMSDKAISQFNNASGPTEQIEVLDSFLKEFLSFPLKLSKL